MFYATLCLLIVTILTRLYLDDRATLPYFPIEVSRMLATGPAATSAFLVVVCLIALFTDDLWHRVACVCVTGVAMVPDNKYWLGHMACVWALLLLVIASVWHADASSQWTVAAALGLYGLRTLIKSIVLVRYEGLPWYDLKQHHQRSQEIMLNTRTTLYTPVMYAHYVGGLLQWASFLLLSSVM